MPEWTEEERHQAIWTALRETVCAVCLDRRDDGSCDLSGGRTCALEAHLPRIIEIVQTVHSPRMDEYVEAIRQRICAVCEHDAQGVCRARDDGACALDAYLPLVVEAIEEAERILKERPV